MEQDKSKYIHRLDEGVPTVLENEAWTIEGRKATKRTKPENIVAAIKDNKYLVRVNQKYELCNPYSNDSLERDRKLAKKVGDSIYKNVETTAIAYEYYLKFLKGRDTAFLKLAQANINPEKMRVNHVAMTAEMSSANDALKNQGLTAI